jgi:hypothetical protein
MTAGYSTLEQIVEIGFEVIKVFSKIMTCRFSLLNLMDAGTVLTGCYIQKLVWILESKSTKIDRK